MTTLLRLLSVATLVVVAAITAWSYPTIYGDTGLVLTPTADVTPYTHVNLAANYTQVKTEGVTFNLFPIRLSYGVGSNVELFVLSTQASGNKEGEINAVGGGAKIALLKEELNSRVPGWAVGVRAVRFRSDQTRNDFEAYTVVSKALLSRGNLIDDGFILRVHAGASYSSYSGDVQKNFLSMFAGLSFRQANGNALAIDFVPAQKADGVTYRNATISAAFRHPLSENFWMEIGTTKPYGIGQSTIYTGVTYHFADQTSTPEREPVLY